MDHQNEPTLTGRISEHGVVTITLQSVRATAMHCAENALQCAVVAWLHLQSNRTGLVLFLGA